MTVPALVGMAEDEAAATTDDLGLGLHVEGAQTDCDLVTVTEQQPPAGRPLAPGSTDTVTAGCPTARTAGPPARPSPRLVRLAERFIAYAAGDETALPGRLTLGTIDLYLGNRLLSSIDDFPAGDPGVRDAFRLCPPEGTYAAAVCPFSALDVLSGDHDRRIVSEPQAPPCVAAAPVPADLARHPQVSITSGSTCVDWSAVTLYDIAPDRLAVNLLHAEP